jgi:predicted unusual protein kinase regulating ubiquinone biosynthesis (AarF/ABC1/UbiB family)
MFPVACSRGAGCRDHDGCCKDDAVHHVLLMALSGRQGVGEMQSHTHRISRLRRMGRFLALLRLFAWTLLIMYRERRRMMSAQAHGNDDSYSNGDALVRVATAFREAALKQDVLLIKLGQFLSTRVDLLPEQAITILSTLQDDVPAAPFDRVREVIESELGRPIAEVFTVLESQCTAAASLGQVHKAVLASTGETVAVKVQRPQIDQLVEVDLHALRAVIWIITHFIINTRNVIDLMDFYGEFARTIYEELDYVREAANAKRLAAMFKDDPTISIPRVYERYVSRRLLVLEWIDGIKINDYAGLAAAGIDDQELARRTVDAYFYQFFEIGFFHADPHPANLLVKAGEDGCGPIVTLVDFGMVGSYTPQMRHLMRDAILAILARDAASLASALSRLGFIGDGADLPSLEHSLSLLLERYSYMRLGEVEEVGLTSLLQDIGRLLYGQPFRIPAQFALTARAVGLLISVATALDPELDFIAAATPYARIFLRPEGAGVDQLVRLVELFASQVLGTGTAVLKIPQAIEGVLVQLETGQFGLNVTTALRGPAGLRRRKSESSTGSNAITPGFSWPAMFAIALAGGILLLMTTHQFLAAWFCFLLAIVCGVRGWLKS